VAGLGPGDRCSLRSLAADEPLGGTASTIRRWLLLEHAGPWGYDGLADARLADGVGPRLRDLGRRSGARVLLIRRPVPVATDGVRCFAVDTADGWAGTVRLDRIEDAAGLDPRDRDAFAPSPAPPVVVCTHGKRDVCCAERGRPLARATALAYPDRTWESTHVGGDRFAANLVAFPHGLYFGRLQPGEGPEIVRAYDDGRIGRLDRYRGRSAHPTHTQVADRELRERLGLDGIDAVRVERGRRHGDRAEVAFATTHGPHRVLLERSFGAPMRLTCQSAHEEAPARWRVLAIEAIERG
jgi:hypothetical protein